MRWECADLPPHGHLRLSGVMSSEEQFASLTYGLKGNIDAVVTGLLLDPSTGRARAELPLPFELKTGQRKYKDAQHNAQLLVYTLLLSRRTGAACRSASSSTLSSPPSPTAASLSCRQTHARSHAS